MSSFHQIAKLALKDDCLIIDVVELLTGSPDGLIGLPLEVSVDSKRYRIAFHDVGRIEIEPEPICKNYEASVHVEPFLFKDPESKMLEEHRWDATTFNFGRRFGKESDLMHYIVLGENFVVHVLTLAAPEITSIASDA